MMKTIALIGTNHIYQTQSPRCQPEDAQAFQCFLLQACRQYGIKTVAEELSTQALEMTREAWEENKKDLERRKESGAWIEEDLEKELKRCEEALKWHTEGMSIPQRAAKELTRKHLFCDPDGKQRALLEIEDETAIEIERLHHRSISDGEAKRRIRESWTKREHYWLGRLLEVPESEWPVLFICGKEHVERFSTILKQRAFSVTVIRKDWKPEISTEYESRM